MTVLRTLALLLAIVIILPTTVRGQVDQDQTGAWYIVSWKTGFQDSRFGLEGDVQYRNWDLGGDLEQVLLRAGVTYAPSAIPVGFTFGAAHITSGAFGDSDATTAERRVYQQATYRLPIGDYLTLRHRYRFEQRWVDGQDFRTRVRYAVFADVPLNGKGTGDGAIYLALYDEVFINGQLSIGDGRTVQRFDRNRVYAGLGYGLSDAVKLQGGYMRQTLTNGTKGQLQVSASVSF